MTGKENANKITKVSRNSPQNISERVENETKIYKEIYISPAKRQKIIDDPRLKNKKIQK